GEMEVVKELFPILTNIDMTDMEDDEIEKAIENPSIHLMIANQEVAQIIIECNTLFMQRVKSELLHAESELASLELLNTIPATIISRSNRDGENGELMKQVEEASVALEKALQKEEDEQLQEQ